MDKYPHADTQLSTAAPRAPGCQESNKANLDALPPLDTADLCNPGSWPISQSLERVLCFLKGL